MGSIQELKIHVHTIAASKTEHTKISQMVPGGQGVAEK